MKKFNTEEKIVAEFILRGAIPRDDVFRDFDMRVFWRIVNRQQKTIQFDKTSLAFIYVGKK